MKKQGRPRCETTKTSILKAAFDLLVQNGLAGLSVEAIAKQAEVSKATIYRWWPNRAAVIIDAFFEATVPQIEFPKTDSALADLRCQLSSVIRMMSEESGQMISAIIAEGQRDPEIAEAFRIRFSLNRRSEAKEVLKRAVDNREIRPDIDFDVALDALYGPMYYRLLVWKGPLDESFLTALMDMVFHGIRIPEKSKGKH